MNGFNVRYAYFIEFVGSLNYIPFYTYSTEQLMSEEKVEILQQLESIFHDTFSDGDYDFSMETIREDIEGWDSLNHIRLLTAIETHFEIQFDLDEIENMSSVESIVDTLQRRCE